MVACRLLSSFTATPSKEHFALAKNKGTDIRDITVRLPFCPIALYNTVTVNLGSPTILRLIDPQLAAA